MDCCRATCTNGKPCSCRSKHGDYCGKHKNYSITHTIRHPLFNNNTADILRRVIDKKDELWMSGFYCFICRHYTVPVIFNQQKAAAGYIYFKQFTNNISKLLWPINFPAILQSRHSSSCIVRIVLETNINPTLNRKDEIFNYLHNTNEISINLQSELLNIIKNIIQEIQLGMKFIAKYRWGKIMDYIKSKNIVKFMGALVIKRKRRVLTLHRWSLVKNYLKTRTITMFLLGITNERLCAPGGKWRLHDVQDYENDCGYLS